MAFEPSDTLKSRTFLGLILAQFLAAFNDQAIHASAMFYAINHKVDGTHGILTPDQAIFLMPILFYAPWAIFCTLAGYFADRYSKRTSLVTWKIAEVVITLVALAGFWMGTSLNNPLGPWVVMATVFLMGTHSAFFVPAKYGVMPEILQPQQLSKGNGVLESTSFLAVILGTVSGGVLSFQFRHEEYHIGLILVGLALVGAVASLLIRRMPAANPHRAFPVNLVKPLLDNLKILLRSRPLALAVLGIAFFTFMVAFMRCTVYRHGESQHPRWDEFHTSMVVATVALGVGLGSPLAGVFSGGKVELGLVPFGAVGMIAGTLLAALYIAWVPGLIAALVVIGFFSGFYIVPLYTLLQHRAPKTSKGDLIATSNFVNVTGAIVASLLFYGLVWAARAVGVAAPVPQQDGVAHGELWNLKTHRGRPAYFEVRESAESPPLLTVGQIPVKRERDLPGRLARILSWANGHPGEEINVDETLKDGDLVDVSRYMLRGNENYQVRAAGSPLEDAYDQQDVPRYLFIGASGLTLAILILLCRQLPDFFVRSLLWLRAHGRTRVKVVGVNNLPSNGPVILATNCDRFQDCMLVLAATDRFTRFVLLESATDEGPRRPLLRFLARRTGLVVLRGTIHAARWERALASANRTLDKGDLLGLTAESAELAQPAAKFLQDLLGRKRATLLPVYCGSADPAPHADGWFGVRRMRVVIGHPLPPLVSVGEVRQAIRALGEWIQHTEYDGAPPTTVMIPGAAASAAPES
jgi:MFS family permease